MPFVFDDRGRWTDLRKQGVRRRGSVLGAGEARQLFSGLARLGRYRPAELPYDVAGWGGRDRWTAYVSAALGDSIMAMRVRDGWAAFRWLKAQPGTARVVIGGHGLGAVVALHIAALAGDAAGVFCDEMPASIEMLVSEKEVNWPPEAFMPEILRHFDLPDLAGIVKGPVRIGNPWTQNNAPWTWKSLKSATPRPWLITPNARFKAVLTPQNSLISYWTNIKDALS